MTRELLPPIERKRREHAVIISSHMKAGNVNLHPGRIISLLPAALNRMVHRGVTVSSHQQPETGDKKDLSWLLVR